MVDRKGKCRKKRPSPSSVIDLTQEPDSDLTITSYSLPTIIHSTQQQQTTQDEIYARLLQDTEYEQAIQSMAQQRSSSSSTFRFQPYHLSRSTPTHSNDIDANANANLDYDYDALWDLSNRIGNVKHDGLLNQVIQQLPTKVFKKVRSSSPSSTNDESCVICLNEYKAREKLMGLPCFHWFHSNCIRPWLTSNSKCPICRVDVKSHL